MFGTWGHIGRGIWFPGEVRVILLVGNCRYYSMGLVVACIDLRHFHILTSNPSLRGPLDMVLLGGQWVGN